MARDHSGKHDKKNNSVIGRWLGLDGIREDVAATRELLQQYIQQYGNKLTQIINNQETIMADLSELTTAVRAQTSVVESANTLLGQLADKIDELANQVEDPNIQAQINDLATEVRGQSQSLSDAVAASDDVFEGGGTPVEPEPEPEPAPPEPNQDLP